MDILKKILHSDNENDLEEFLIFIAERLNQKNGEGIKSTRIVTRFNQNWTVSKGNDIGSFKFHVSDETGG